MRQKNDTPARFYKRTDNLVESIRKKIIWHNLPEECLKKPTIELLAIGKFSLYSDHLLPGNKLLKTKEVNEAPNLIGYLQNQTVIRLRVKMFTITCYFLYIFSKLQHYLMLEKDY